jgi:phosphatidylglycerophosphatase GEP4
MVQSINTKAIIALAAVFRRPGLIVPHVSVATCSDINYDALAQYAGIQAIIFDKDHTLTLPYSQQLHPLCQFGVEAAHRVFGKHRVAILSNSAGTASDDPNNDDARAIEETLGIPVIRHVEKKPGGINETLDYFQLTDASRICIIGDRILTDIVFGNLYGMLTVHTQPLPPHGEDSCNNHEIGWNDHVTDRPVESNDTRTKYQDNWTARIIRPIENKLLYGSFGQRYLNPHYRLEHDVWSGDEKQHSLILLRKGIH